MRVIPFPEIYSPTGFLYGIIQRRQTKTALNKGHKGPGLKDTIGHYRGMDIPSRVSFVPTYSSSRLLSPPPSGIEDDFLRNKSDSMIICNRGGEDSRDPDGQWRGSSLLFSFLGSEYFDMLMAFPSLCLCFLNSHNYYKSSLGKVSPYPLKKIWNCQKQQRKSYEYSFSSCYPVATQFSEHESLCRKRDEMLDQNVIVTTDQNYQGKITL